MGCSSCASKAKRATPVATKKVVQKETQAKKKRKVKPVTKFMHLQASGINMRRAFNSLQARAQKRAKKKGKQI